MLAACFVHISPSSTLVCQPPCFCSATAGKVADFLGIGLGLPMLQLASPATGRVELKVHPRPDSRVGFFLVRGTALSNRAQGVGD